MSMCNWYPNFIVAYQQLIRLNSLTKFIQNCQVLRAGYRQCGLNECILLNAYTCAMYQLFVDWSSPYRHYSLHARLTQHGNDAIVILP